MIRVTIERPSPALAAQWQALVPFAANPFMHPTALKAASDTLFAMITVLLAWDATVEPNRLVGWWALESKHLLFWPYLKALPFNYAFLSTPVIAPGLAPEVMPAFLAAIAARRDLPDTLRFSDFDGEGPAAEALGALALPRTLLVTDQRPATRDNGLKRSGSTRKLRQDWNRLAATGALEASTCATRRDRRGGRSLPRTGGRRLEGHSRHRALSHAADAAFARRFTADMAAAGLASVACAAHADPSPRRSCSMPGAPPIRGRRLRPGARQIFARHAAGRPHLHELLDSGAIDTVDSRAVAEGFMGSC